VTVSLIASTSVFRRRDLASFLALAPGFRFEVTEGGGSAIFDEGVLKSD
jgi:hypothetical protein